MVGSTGVGTKLDRYEIEAELGRGAMGVVYRARDPKLDRIVAIKTVSLAGLDTAAEQEYRKRFVIEAQAAGRLSHPGIVTVFDVREEPAPYLVMEYVDGQSLQHLVNGEKQPLPLSSTLRLVQEVAEALHYAHLQGVVHRDIKPANILVNAEGHPKIADFGIAKLNQAELTLPGQVLGSPAFMAPEQLSDESADARSDLFSLGVILYYMLTGHRPFQGNSTTTVCFKLINHEPPCVSAFEPKFPPELDRIVSRAIAKNPADRYQTGSAMAAELQILREKYGLVRNIFEPAGTGGIAEANESEQTGKDPLPAFSSSVTTARTAGHAAARENAAKPPKASLIPALLAVATVCVVLLGAHFVRRSGDISLEQSSPPSGLLAASGTPEQKKDADVPAPGANNEKTATPVLISTPASAKAASVATAPANIMLRIEIEHHFTDATASVWVDNNLIYQQSLRGEAQRRALLIKKVVGHESEVVQAPAGHHQVRVRVQSAADSYDQSRIVAHASLRDSAVLHVVCPNKGDGPMQIVLLKRAYQKSIARAAE